MSFISRNAECPCGSQLKYKNCCGKLSATPAEENSGTIDDHPLNHNGFYNKSLMDSVNEKYRLDLPESLAPMSLNAPPGMMIIEDFLTPELCEALIKQTENAYYKQATIVSSQNQSQQERVVEKDRKTDIVGLGDYDKTIKDLLLKEFRNHFGNKYNDEIEWFEQPQLLRYKVGGFYHYHADAESWRPAQKSWVKTMNRDYSFLIYLNDDFEGGEILFPNFEFEMKPQKGMFVCFPSDHRFIHKVNPTRSGIRYAIVTWAGKIGADLVNNHKPGPNEVVYVR